MFLLPMGFTSSPTEPPFVPTDISGLKFWADGTDSSTMTLRNGGDGYNYVNRWYDKVSGTANFVHTNSVNQPRKLANSVYTYQSNIFLQSQAIALSNTLAFFMVFKPVSLTAFTGYNSFIGGFATTTSATGGIWQLYSNSGSTTLSANFSSTGDDLSATNFLVEGQTTLVSLIKNSSEARLRKNGTQVAADLVADTTIDNYAMLLGRWNSNQANAEYMELLVYSNVLTQTQIDQVENYLKQKWGL